MALPFDDPGVHDRLIAPSAGSPATGDSSGASGRSTTATSMRPVTSRAVELVASCTETSTMFVEAPISSAALTVIVPFSPHCTVILALSSLVHETTVSGVSGKGLYAPDSTFTCCEAPALSVTRWVGTWASGRVDWMTRTVMPADTVPPW